MYILHFYLLVLLYHDVFTQSRLIEYLTIVEHLLINNPGAKIILAKLLDNPLIIS